MSDVIQAAAIVALALIGGFLGLIMTFEGPSLAGIVATAPAAASLVMVWFTRWATATEAASGDLS